MALALGLAGLVMMRQALHLPIGWTAVGPGSGFFPFWLSVGLTLAAAVLFRQGGRPAAKAAEEDFIPVHAWKPLVVVFLPILAVIALIDYLGIYLGGALYLIGNMRLVGRSRWAVVVLVSVLIPLVLFFIFERWFLLPMPKGAILEYVLYER